jgi:hypothetical protein
MTHSAVNMTVNAKFRLLRLVMIQGSSNYGYLSIARHIVFKIMTNKIVESK